MRRTASRYGPVVVALVVTVAFSYLALRNVDFHQLSQSLRRSNYWWLVPSAALLVLGVLIRVHRWRVLFAPAKRPAFWPTTEALLVGQFLNNVLPLRAGDAARIVALRSFGGQSGVETAGTVVVERFFDVLSLLLLLFLALPWFPEVASIRTAGVLASALTLVLVAGIVVLRVYGDRPIRFLVRPLGPLPFLLPGRLEVAVANLMHGLVALRSARIGVIAFLWTTASWLVLAVSFWLVMIGFDLGLSPAAGLLVLIATSLSLILPSGPAAVGVFEAAAIVALRAYDVPQSQALSYALVVHALTVLPFVAAGLVVLNFHRGALKGAFGGNRGLSGGGVQAAPGGSGLGTDRDGPGDEEDDVSEPADRQLHVDEAREPH
jgi:glycosyltransferase 2 family protein